MERINSLDNIISKRPIDNNREVGGSLKEGQAMGDEVDHHKIDEYSKKILENLEKICTDCGGD